LNQWSGEQLGGNKYGTERRDQPLEISAEAGEADAGHFRQMQRQQETVQSLIGPAWVMQRGPGLTQSSRG